MSKQKPIKTLVEAIQRAALRHPAKAAYTFLADGEAEAGSLTYADLDREARLVAARLATVAQAGERALLLYPPGLEFVVAFFGCLYAGVIAVPVYAPRANSNLDRIASIVKDCQARVVMSVGRVARQFSSQFSQVLDLKALPWLETELPGVAAPFVLPLSDISLCSTAFLQYTSGSTSSPRGVMVSHDSLAYHVGMIDRLFAQGENTVAVAWIPMYHDMGLIGLTLSPVYAGGSVIFMSPAAFLQRPLRWLQAISRYRGTLTAAPNFAYELCVRKITAEQKKGLDLRSWQTAVNGAEPVRKATLDAFMAAFSECGLQETVLRPSYGLAEATLVVSASRRPQQFSFRTLSAEHLDQHRVVEVPASDTSGRVLVNCGQSLKGHKIAIVDPETLAECPKNQVGEIWTRGRSIAQGYWNNPELTRQTFQARIPGTGEGPFLRTGDLGFLLDRELFITGRLKDLIILNGRNHYPQDIELTVERVHPAMHVSSGAAFSIEAGGEERLVIVQEIERTQIRGLNLDDLKDSVRQAVAAEHEVEVYDVQFLKPLSIPKTSSGKIQRGLCRKRYLAGTLEILQPRPALSRSAAVEAAQERTEIAPHPASAAMQFSLFYFSANDAEFQNEKYRLFLEGARFADEHGFTAVWVPERHFHSFGGIYPNPSVLASALAVTTSNIRIRAGSVVLPLHHPIRVAEEWAAVDNLSHGRVDLAFARGWNPNDFVLSPQNFADSLGVLYRGMETVRQLWRGESLAMPNGQGKETNIRIYPLPQQAELSIWITCSGGKERFVEAGAGGWNVLTALLFQSVDELREKIAAYREARARNGHDPSTGCVTLMLHTFVGEEDRVVKDLVRGPFIEYLKTSVDLWRQRSIDLDSLEETERNNVLDFAFERYYRTSGLFGTPESCMETVSQLQLAGVNEIACLIDFGVPVKATLKGLRTLHQLAEKFGSGRIPLSTVPPAAEINEPEAAARHSVPAMASRVEPNRAGESSQDFSTAVCDEGAPASRAMLRWITGVIRTAIARVTGTRPENVSTTKNFLGLGINSLKAIEIMEAIQGELNVKLSPALLFEFPTIELLASALGQEHRQHLLARVPDALGQPDKARPAAALAAKTLPSTPAPRHSGTSNNDIAVIGMACRFPGAQDLNAYWKLLAEGQDAVTEVPPDHWDWKAYFSSDANAENKTYSRWGGFLGDIALFDAAFFNISPREARLLDPQQRIMLETSWHTFEHAGYAPESLAAVPVGVFLGASYNGYYQQIRRALKQSDHSAGVGNQNAIIANRVSYALNLHGPSMLVDTLCSSSLVALHLACQSIKNGECAIALAGGINILLAPENYVAMSRMKAHAPDGRCKPFDHRANGICFGEGVGTVLLKPLAQALADGDTVYAVIKGSALNHGGQANGLLAPNPQAQAQLVRQAVQSAGISPDSISYVEAHGTGTSLGDPIEIEGLTKAFRQEGTSRTGKCAVGSVKSNIGHLESAAGIAGIIKVILAMQHRQLPPTLHFEKANPLIAFEQSGFTVQTQLTDWNPPGPRRAGVSSFGIGGSNAHVILEEAPPVGEGRNGVESPGCVLTLSAKSQPALHALASQWITWLGSGPPPVADLCFTATAGRSHFPHRLAITTQSHATARQKLEAFTAGHSAEGLYSGQVREDSRPSIAFLFTGQGSQYAAMGQQLYEVNDAFRCAMNECDEILRARVQLPLLDRLFAADARDAFTADAVFAQTALFAFEYALAALWKSWGVVPDFVMGHSLGEYSAALAANVFSLQDGLVLVAERARLIQKHAKHDGAMAAVFADAARVRTILAGVSDKVCVAALNGPNHVVISGDASALTAVLKEISAQGITAERLQVTHAFHSPLLDPVLRPFEDAVAALSYRPPRVPLVSNVTGALLRSHDVQDAQYWTSHLREPVLFEAGAKAILEQDGTILLEIGPSAALTGMVRRLRSNAAAVVPSIRTGKPEWESVLEALAQLYVAGVRVDWKSVAQHGPRRRTALPLYPFDRQRYWMDAPDDAAKPEQILSSPALDASVSSTAARAHVVSGREQAPAALADQKGLSRRESILAVLRRSLAGFLEMEEAQVDDHKSFLAMGSDSLVLIEAVQAIQEEFGIRLAIRQLFEETTTLATLAEHLDRTLPFEAKFTGWPPKAAKEIGPARQAQEAASNTAAASNKEAIRQADARLDLGGNVFVSAQGAVPPADSVIERVIAQQLAAMDRLMQQQLQVLSNPGVHSSSAPVVAEKSMLLQVATAPVGVSESSATIRHGVDDSLNVSLASAQPWVPYQPLNPGSMDEFTIPQQKYLREFIVSYNARTARSKEATQKHRWHHADLRAAMSFRRCTKEIRYPIVGVRSDGAELWDLDGNRYVDFTMGYGVNLFGHNPPFVMEALQEQMEKGIHVGPQSELAGEVADLFCEVSGMERATFCNSGTEAVMAALRIARVSTGKNKVAIFAGSYHGTSDGVLAVTQRAGGQSQTVPMIPGLPPGMVNDVVLLHYGQAKSLEMLEADIHQFAAVLVEPVQSRKPELQPREFLHKLRKITADAGVVLIFDEVITGFRVHPRGAQGWFGVDADLATYGKVVGGGLPIGVVAGKAACMDSIDGGVWSFGDDSVPAARTTLYTGTFCKHPLAMAAAKAVLLEVKKRGPALFDGLNTQTEQLAQRLNDALAQAHAPVEVVRFGSLFRLGGPLQLMSGDALDLLYYHLIHNGIYVWEGRNWFLSTAHSAADLDLLVDVMTRSVRQLQDTGFLPAVETTGKFASNSTAEASGFTAQDAKNAGAAEVPLTTPLTQAQRDLWLLSQVNHAASLSYNQSVCLRLHGAMRVPALQSALEAVTQRHDALRTTFSENGEFQRVHASLVPQLSQVDLSGALQPDDAVADWLNTEAQALFELSGLPLWRTALLKCGADEHIFVLTIHHLIADGWSIGVLLQEISAGYSAAVEGRRLELAPALQFGDFTQYMNQEMSGARMESAEAYWLEQLENPPVVALPLDHPRSNTRSGRRVQETLDPSVAAQLMQLSAQTESTLFMTLLAAYTLFLASRSGQDDIVVVTPVAGQAGMNSARLIGDCSNLVAIRSRLHSDIRFSECVQMIKGRLMQSSDWQLYPFARLARKLRPQRDPSQWPFFNIDRPLNTLKWSGLSVTDMPFPNRYTNFDFGLNVTIVGGKVELAFDYKSDLFDRRTIEGWSRQFLDLLSKVVADQTLMLSSLPRPQFVPADVPGPSGQPAYVAPRTAVEELLEGIWAEVLGKERVSVFADFFDLGGHSLLATQIVSRVREMFGTDVGMDYLFEKPSIAGLAEYLETRGHEPGKEKQERITPAARNENVPLSSAQRRLWLIEQLQPGCTAYNMVGAVRLHGQLDFTALQKSLDDIVQRHEALRTVFLTRDGAPVQVVLPPQSVSISHADLLDVQEDERRNVIVAQGREMARQPFDLARGPLLCFRLLTFSEGEHALVVTVHHMVSDGWSMGILLRELGTLYQAFSNNQPSPLADLAVQFADYAVWENSWLQSSHLHTELDYWLKQLLNVPAFLELPADRSRTAIPGFQGAHEPFSLNAQLAAQLNQLCRQEGVTLFMALLSCISLLLHRYSGQEDFVIGTDVANRNRVETENVIGCFVNLLPLRMELAGDPTFREYLRRARKVTLGAYAHQSVPFDQLIRELRPERKLTSTPLVQVLFVLQNAPLEIVNSEDARMELVPVSMETAEFELIFNVEAVSGELTGTVGYSLDLFERGTIQAMIAHLQTLVAEVIRNPEARLSSFSLLSEADRAAYAVAYSSDAQLSQKDLDNLLLRLNAASGK